jgi:peptidoglycan-associated lipoprotein
MYKRLLEVAVLGLLVAVVGVGCAAKKKKGEQAGGEGTIGEEGLAPGGSLEQYKKGTLGEGGEETGPLQDIHFAFDSFELEDPARSTLRENGNWLKDHAQSKVEIEGHCDERGTVEYNLALGAKRARAAKDYLVALGVAAERLTTISYGEELPLCHEPTEECWQKNRRAHFVVLGE